MSYYQDTTYTGPSNYTSTPNEFSSALSHTGTGDDSSSSSLTDHPLFNAAVSFLESRKSQYSEPSNYDIDEDKYLRAHSSLYNQSEEDDRDTHDSDSLGAGAAMQALKMFTSSSSSSHGESGSGFNTGSESGGFDKNKLIGLAMAQAGKLWDEKNGAGKASGDKQSAINAAAETALKMYMKSQGGGIGGTGGPSGSSGLLKLAGKFLS